MLSDPQRRFLDRSRVAHLATADRSGSPHLVPVCFCLSDLSLYITVDEKPKRADIPLKRIRNILENPAVAVTVDRWDEDWTRLAWIMLRGEGTILTYPGHRRPDQANSVMGRAGLGITAPLCRGLSGLYWETARPMLCAFRTASLP
jgi:PPOX class probable F420-dependent enzyme